MIFKIGPKKIVAVLVTLLGILLLLISGKGFYKGGEPTPTSELKVENQAVRDLGKVKLLSTTPANLNGKTLLPTDSIEITFDTPTEAFDPSYHVVVEPKAELNVKISNDLKTITIKPVKSWAVGTTYHLLIKENLKFKGDPSASSGQEVTLGEVVKFDFNTLAIKGI